MPSRDSSRPVGRLGAFTILGAAAGSVPLPWVPASLARRVRGALVQDVSARHGLSLSWEARSILAEPAKGEPTHKATREALRYLVLRMLPRLTPVRLLGPVRTALDTFVLGHLFERYIAARQSTSPYLDGPEARSLREMIDRSLVHALTASLEPNPDAPRLPAAQETRDELTQAVDNVLIGAATVPSWLVRHLDKAFDDLLAQGPHGGA